MISEYIHLTVILQLVEVTRLYTNVRKIAQTILCSSPLSKEEMNLSRTNLLNEHEQTREHHGKATVSFDAAKSNSVM
jgi:hypothetical protein